MKKTTSLLLCLLSVILLTGCGSNKLSCSLKEEDNYVSYEYEIEFKEDKIDSINILWNYDFSDIEDFSALGCLSLEDCVSKAKAQADTCESGTIFENCKVVKETEKEVIISAEVTKKELDSDDSLLNSKTDKETAKKQLEEDGFKCE